jgi:3-oxoacyl-[acyl-carrier protein] reductase
VPQEPGRVLVTGASRGIGHAIALRLAEAGWKVAIHYSQAADAAAETLSQLGAQAAGCYQASLENPTEAAPLFHRALEDGPLRALVNNAGIYRPISFLDATDEELADNLSQTFRVNFESPFWLCRVASNYFAEQGSGKILNVASRVGFRGEPGASVYAASKAALIILTRSLAIELAPRQVGVFGIAPGWVETAMVRDGMEARLPEILATLPLGRMASPEDCAAAANFLLSDEASYLSGVTIDINGASYFH